MAPAKAEDTAASRGLAEDLQAAEQRGTAGHSHELEAACIVHDFQGCVTFGNLKCDRLTL